MASCDWKAREEKFLPFPFILVHTIPPSRQKSSGRQVGIITQYNKIPQEDIYLKQVPHGEVPNVIMQ